MKFKHLLMSGLIALLAGFYVVGCNENPIDPDPPTVDPDPPTVEPATGLQAVSLGAESVGLKWNASTTSGVTYKVSWIDNAATPSEGDFNVGTDTETTVEGLNGGPVYTFTVVAVVVEVDTTNNDTTNNESEAATIDWAPADRYINDREKGGIIRIYARSVPSANKGTGVVIQQDGAFNASVGASSQFLSQIHLIADVQANSILIGAPESFDDFDQHSQFRTDVQISDDSVELDPAVGLDGWYNSASLDNLFGMQSTGKFTISDQFTGGVGVAFAMRWGNNPFRYARIFVVPGSDGKLVQRDTDDDPFIEIRISNQTDQGIPYAKR
ncbi:MAG: hypothetical protein J4G05_01465 [Chlorobi bacterium]|nr:hypothetical protein [Chlorobiota bacterium]